MYQNPSQTQSWNPNGAPPPGTNWSQQPPNTPNGSFPQRPGSGNQLPTLQSQPNQPAQPMQTLQPQQHPNEYRQLPQLPPPPHQAQMYQPPYAQAPMPYPPQQPAPRQRTAIACRYCRRRKIRCSGFDQNEEGRCTNCQRFSQECVFTPVSAQTQAFVPAHTVWRGGQGPPPNTQLYGAYGQPLPQHAGGGGGGTPGGNNRDPNSAGYPGGPSPQQQQQQPPQPGQQPQGQGQAGQYPPPPPGYGYPGQPPQAGQQGDQSGTPGGQKRGTDEPQTPTLPGPGTGPGGGAQNAPARDGQQPYGYPDPNDKLGPDGSVMGTPNGAMPPNMMTPRPRNVVDAGTQTESPKTSNKSD